MPEAEEGERLGRDPQLGADLFASAPGRVEADVRAVRDDLDPPRRDAEVGLRPIGGLPIVGEQHVAGASEQHAVEAVEPGALGLMAAHLVDRPQNPVPEGASRKQGNRGSGHFRPGPDVA